MRADRKPADRRLLLLAATARDAAAALGVLGRAGLECMLCPDVASLCAAIEAGAAAVVLPEEAVLADAEQRLRRTLEQQPVWSDLPVIVLARAGAESPALAQALSTLGKVSVVERPMRVSTLVSLLRVALRARERQYQVRDLLASEHAARAEADAANAAKDRFLAVLSHELRTPLSPIALCVSAMETDRALPVAVREQAAMMRRNIDLETKLIDDLLDLSRIANGKLRLSLQPTSVHEGLRHVLAMCAPDLEAKRLTLRTELGARKDGVSADAARLEQVFWNLLKNAVKFTPEGGEITVRSCNRDGRLAVEVRDSGVGIAAETLPRIFDAFEQGEAKPAGQHGLGLGLAISKALMELHGGSIAAASDGRGRGARFVVELPTTPLASGAASDSVRREESRRRRQRRLLVVEDHADTAEVLAALLLSAGYQVETAHNAADALTAAASDRYDLLISDIGLPDASGCELMRRVKELYGIPGVALSGYGMEDDVRRSREAGFAEHIVKPIKLDQLHAVIERVIGDRSDAGEGEAAAD